MSYKRKNTIMISLISIVIIHLCLIYYYSIRDINYVLVGKIVVGQKIVRSMIIHNEVNFIKREFNEINERDTHLAIKIDTALINDETYDYVITFGRDLHALLYCPYLSNKLDACSYTKSVPIIPIYSFGDYDEYIYVYKLDTKGRYRNLCP